jgi:hypothetical protein
LLLELCNIRNCYDETYGTLRIEIPLISKEGDLDSEDNKMNENDKYLELVFDLKDYKFEKIDFYKNKEKKNLLVVKAKKDSLSDSQFERKYVLPGKIFCFTF